MRNRALTEANLSQIPVAGRGYISMHGCCGVFLATFSSVFCHPPFPLYRKLILLPEFGLLETTGISISGSNRRRKEIRIFIATVGAAVSHLKSVESSQLKAPEVFFGMVSGL